MTPKEFTKQIRAAERQWKRMPKWLRALCRFEGS